MTLQLPVTPDEMLADLTFALMHERTPAPTTVEWWTRGALVALRRDEPLEHALRLASPDGGRGGSTARRLRMLKRNAFLAHALNALSQTEGAGAALALLGTVRSGKGEVLCLVRFHGNAVTLEGVYDSHGARSPLFNVTLTHAPDLASGVGGLH